MRTLFRILVVALAVALLCAWMLVVLTSARWP